ncbi:MAG: metallophosphoesterase family protein [Akkermansia sp.]|nr:metallophosphoesterase family protein [Akkermansia sp.]
MLVAVLSDIHDNISHLLTALALAEERGCRHLFVTGDIATLSTLRTLREEWEYEIDLVFGNNEWNRAEHLRLAEQFHHCRHHGDTADFSLDGRHILLTHYPQVAEQALQRGGYDAIFYGHTHKAELRVGRHGIIANPGEIDGVRNAPSFAVYDTANNSLIFCRV